MKSIKDLEREFNAQAAALQILAGVASVNEEQMKAVLFFLNQLVESARNGRENAEAEAAIDTYFRYFGGGFFGFGQHSLYKPGRVLVDIYRQILVQVQSRAAQTQQRRQDQRPKQRQQERSNSGRSQYPPHPDDEMYAEFGGRNAYEALVAQEEMRVEAAWKARTDYAESFFLELQQFEKRWKKDCSGNLDSAAETGYFQSAVKHMRGVCVDLMRRKEDVYLGDPDLLYYYSHNRLGGAQYNFLFYKDLLEAWGRFVKNVPPEP